MLDNTAQLPPFTISLQGGMEAAETTVSSTSATVDSRSERRRELHNHTSSGSAAAVHRVPSAAYFAKLSHDDQVVRGETVQRELDELTRGLRLGAILPNYGTRGRALRNVYMRQLRLNKLALQFGLVRQWRKYVRVPAVSRPALNWV